MPVWTWNDFEVNPILVAGTKNWYWWLDDPSESVRMKTLVLDPCDELHLSHYTNGWIGLQTPIVSRAFAQKRNVIWRMCGLEAQQFCWMSAVVLGVDEEFHSMKCLWQRGWYHPIKNWIESFFSIYKYWWSLLYWYAVIFSSSCCCGRGRHRYPCPWGNNSASVLGYFAVMVEFGITVLVEIAVVDILNAAPAELSTGVPVKSRPPTSAKRPAMAAMDKEMAMVPKTSRISEEYKELVVASRIWCQRFREPMV